MFPQFLNEKEVARITGLAVQTLRNYRCRGEGPAYCKIGKRSVRYPLDDLISFMDKSKIKTNGEN